MMASVCQAEAARAAAPTSRGIGLPLLAAVLVMLVFLTLPRVPTDLDLDTDTSLSEVLSYAHEQGLQFGPDLVCTYGPLGYLIFFYFSPHAAGMRLLLDIVLCFTAAAGLCLVAWRARLAWGCALVGVFVFVTGNLEPRTDLVLHTGLLCWGLLCFVESGWRLTLAAVTFVALAAFGGLAKTSVLFVAGPSVVLLAGDLAIRGHLRLSIGMVAGFGLGVVSGWLGAGQNLLHLSAHLANALVVVRSYNQALGWEALAKASQGGLVVITLAAGTVIIRGLTWSAGPGSAEAASPQSARRAGARRGLLLVWLLVVLFPNWKHGFVRGDSYHVASFLGYVSVLALALEVLACGRRSARLWARALAGACCLVALLTLQSLYFARGWNSLAQPARALNYHARCLLAPGEYIRRLCEAVESNRRRAQLPQLRQIVGRARVDVFGQRQIYALLNGFNYHPRPVFQSYAACTAPLMRLNEQFYLSGAAPEYVLFNLEAIDRRFPPLEDAMLLRHLLLNYEPAGSEGGFVLLRSRSAQASRLKLLREGAVQAGERIELGAFGNANLWLEIRLDPTWLGRLSELLCRPPTVRLAAWREGSAGLLARRRAPAAMLAAGFVARPFLLRTQDVAGFYGGEPGRQASAYSVEWLPGDRWFWQSTARFRVFEIELAADSL